MTEELKKYEKSIQKKHSFGLTPRYKEVFHTDLNQIVFFPIAKQVVNEIGWDLSFEDENLIKAKQKAGGFHWGQKIIIHYESGKVKVTSESIGNQLWDMGRNSKRVKLFIYAFKELEKTYEKDALEELEEQVIRANNWDDYIVPDVLPQPQIQTKPKIWIPIIGGVIISVILGCLLAFFTVKFMYVIGLYEIGVGFLIGLAFKYFIRWGNYTDFDKLNYILVGTVLLTYVLNQYFFYNLTMYEHNIELIGFVNFIKLRFQEGLTIESLNTGWIGLVVSWIFQIGFTYAIAHVQLASHVLQFLFDKTPAEVVDFALYHFIKGKNDEEVRSELSKKGWSRKEDQDDVFNSIGAVREMQLFNKEE